MTDGGPLDQTLSIVDVHVPAGLRVLQPRLRGGRSPTSLFVFIAVVAFVQFRVLRSEDVRMTTHDPPIAARSGRRPPPRAASRASRRGRHADSWWLYVAADRRPAR